MSLPTSLLSKLIDILEYLCNISSQENNTVYQNLKNKLFNLILSNDVMDDPRDKNFVKIINLFLSI